ncbi:Cell cycle checkpoint control protein RAD9A [Orchesella cincta]|uniref:Cell cycle checkpoint control protein RAD9A n=1 Tax=Orchesella cincta TaxID=48709 RepID=A0A1D2N4U4_ORCCI|nr:Cell cycle checkpoint control protein RAD9A [Orchesella cincta]
MKVTIGNANLGTWCRIVHGLTQVGDDEIHFDASDGILTLSTYNASMSNYATVLFFRNFFTSCQMNTDSDEPEKIAVPAKTILKPYRTLKVAKSYLSSEIKYIPSEDFITVTSEGKTHVSTTYKLGATESSSEIQFECDPYAMKNILKTDAKVLASGLSNFNHMKGLSELTLKIQGERVMLKNTVTDVARKDGTVVTEYNLTSHDFIEFEVEEETVELAFGFREFKIFTAFAEQLKVPVSIHFQSQDDPVIVTVKTQSFEARLCMATRIRDPFEMTGADGSQSTGGSNGRISNVTSQSCSESRNVSLEVNRRVDSGTLEAERVAVEASVPEEPAAKRPRRTDLHVEPSVDLVELPVGQFEASVNQVEVSVGQVEPSMDHVELSVDQEDADGNGMVIDTDPVALNIHSMVQQMEKRAKSIGYRTLQNLVNTPRITEEEYLESLPGHDQILCPESDDDESA